MTAKLYIGVFMLLAGTLYSCQKDEEMNKLDADYRVMTDYDPETDFSQFRSYYLADSILFVGQDEKPQYLDSQQAGPILNACHRNMQERGYSRAASKEKADLGLHQYLPFCGIHRFTLLVVGIFRLLESFLLGELGILVLSASGQLQCQHRGVADGYVESEGRARRGQALACCMAKLSDRSVA